MVVVKVHIMMRKIRGKYFSSKFDAKIRIKSDVFPTLRDIEVVLIAPLCLQCKSHPLVRTSCEIGYVGSGLSQEYR